MVGDQRSRILSEINVTPLVDVVLVLLIIFMVFVPLMQSGYDLVIPDVERSRSPAERDRLVVFVEASGSVSINRQFIKPADLEPLLSRLLRSRSSKAVFFSAADEANYGETVAVLDVVRQAGASPIGVIPLASIEAEVR
jgi:biopolymer transport protein TolR